MSYLIASTAREHGGGGGAGGRGGAGGEGGAGGCGGRGGGAGGEGQAYSGSEYLGIGRSKGRKGVYVSVVQSRSLRRPLCRGNPT